MVKTANRKGLINTIPDTRDRTSKAAKVREGDLIARRAERDELAAAIDASSTSRDVDDRAFGTEPSESDKPSSEQERAWEVERELKEERAKVSDCRGLHGLRASNRQSQTPGAQT